MVDVLVAASGIGVDQSSVVPLVRGLIFCIGIYLLSFLASAPHAPRVSSISMMSYCFAFAVSFCLLWLCLHEHASHDVTVAQVERLVDAALRSIALLDVACGMA